MLAHDRSGEHPQGDLGQLILLAVFLAVWTADSFFVRFSTFAASFVPFWLRGPGAGILFVLAGLLVYQSHGVLHVPGAVRKLRTEGAFAYVRHPLYLSVWFVYFGLIITTMSLASLAVMTVVIPFYDHIARYEERFLEDIFGQEYISYKARVPRWIPGLRPRGRKSPS